MESIWPSVMRLSKSSAEAIRILSRCYQKLLLGDLEGSRMSATDLTAFESDVDNDVHELKDRIARSDIFASIKHEVLEIVRLLEESVDGAMEAARIMTLRKLEPSEIELVKGRGDDPGLDRIFSLLVQMTGEVTSTLELVQKNLMEANRRADNVEEIEESIDKIKLALLERLYASENELKIMSLLQLKELILAMDSIADTLEDVSDEVETISSIATL